MNLEIYHVGINLLHLSLTTILNVKMLFHCCIKCCFVLNDVLGDNISISTSSKRTCLGFFANVSQN